MSNYTFIKNPDILEEDYRVNDLLDFSTNINKLTEQLIRIKNNSMVGLVGPYGCGKSTLLYQLYKKYPDEESDYGNPKINATNLKEVRNAKWFTFDAWQYPERKDLWDGFIIELARSMSDKCLKEIKKEIDGNQNSGTQTAIKAIAATTGKIPILNNITDAVKEIIVGSLDSPTIKRVFEFQDLLRRMINKIDKDIYIVIEDIDRSGDKGIFFLETLSHFIKSINSEHNETDSKHKIIVIVPMGDEVFKEQGNRNARNSYLKILDYQVKFNPQDINLYKFISEVINVEDFIHPHPSNRKSDYLSLTGEILHKLFSRFIIGREKGTIRDIKHLLRRANKNYNTLKVLDGGTIEPMLVLLFTATEYFNDKNGKKERYCFTKFALSPVEERTIHDTPLIVMPSIYWLYRIFLVYLGEMRWDALTHEYFYIEKVKAPYILHLGEGSVMSQVCNSTNGAKYADKTIVLINKYFDLIPDELIEEVDGNIYIKKDSDQQ